MTGYGHDCEFTLSAMTGRSPLRFVCDD